MASISAARAPTSRDSASRMRATSRSSSICSVRTRLLASSAASGSTNSVCPLELVSWTMLGRLDANSALIGITNRPLRTVTMRSWIAFACFAELQDRADAVARVAVRLRQAAADASERGRGAVEHRAALVDRVGDGARQLAQRRVAGDDRPPDPDVRARRGARRRPRRSPSPTECRSAPASVRPSCAASVSGAVSTAGIRCRSEPAISERSASVRVCSRRTASKSLNGASSIASARPRAVRVAATTRSRTPAKSRASSVRESARGIGEAATRRASSSSGR